MVKSHLSSLLLVLVLVGHCTAGELEWLRLPDDAPIDKRAKVAVDALGVQHLGATLFREFVVASHEQLIDWAETNSRASLEAQPRARSIHEAVVVSWLRTFQEIGRGLLLPSLAVEVQCEGNYRHHLQGICTNRVNAFYWCFTTTLVKTDATGKVLKEVPVADHHGDLCFHDGKIYVAVNHGRFNDPEGNADSWVYVYKAKNLAYITRHKTPEVFYGAGGIACDGKRFIVVGGLPRGAKENLVYEYDQDFKFVASHILESGYTLLGIQTATFADGHWWFGCYGSKLVKTDRTFAMLANQRFECATGIVAIGRRRFVLGKNKRINNGHSAQLSVGFVGGEGGLVLRE